MSTSRVHPGAGFCDPAKLPRGPNGRALCRQCRTEVPVGRRTFCGDDCVRVWRVKTDPGAIRQEVEKRDHGVCASCGRDCIAVERKIDAVLKAGWVYPTDHKAFMRMRRLIRWLCRFGLMRSTSGDRHVGTLWDADHIRPVCEGGGPDDGDSLEQILANLRTLCVPCHKAETRELARRRAEARRAKRPQMSLNLQPAKAS